MASEESYKKRIAELEAEVAERERDLEQFRQELSKANSQLQSMIGQMRQELKLAQAIHKHLVPTDFPNIPGFEFSTKYVPSAKRGGDYFDIFEHEDRFRFGAILASSSGYAMSALLMSVLLKLTRQMEARKGADPHIVARQIIDDLLPNMEMPDRAELFYGLFDRRSFELTYCRIGQVFAYVQNYQTGELKALESSGGSITKHFSQPIKSHSLSLSPRDRVILCSAGISESRNIDGEEFGQERLIKAIMEAPRQGVHELRHQIFYQLQKFTGGVEADADCTVVVAEVKDRVIKLAKKTDA